jgi:hypothetical protein
VTKTILLAGAAAVLLTGCNMFKAGPPPKRQPGSWSQKIELKKFEGKDADKARAGLEQALAMANAMSVCITPEVSEKEDAMKNFEKIGGPGATCTFAKKSVTSAGIDVDGVCKMPSGKSTKVTVSGTLSPTSQDMTMTIEGLETTGAREGLMEMHTVWTRNGECKPTDMKVPAGATM